MKNSEHTIQNENEVTYSTSHAITSDTALRNIIPSAPALLNKRIQPRLDFFSLEFMHQANVVILGTTSNIMPMTPLLCKSNVSIESENQLTISNLPNSWGVKHNEKQHSASLFFMVSGIGHNLRINGTFTIINAHNASFHIEGVYFHCARAATRSDFWQFNQTNNKPAPITEHNIIHQSPYVLLKTQNQHGKTEISPRGDEMGFIKQLTPRTLFMPERPGNKVAVSLRNIIACTHVELLFIVPNNPYTLNIYGQAHATNDPKLLALSEVNGKQPKVGIIIEVTSKQFQFDEHLTKSNLWNNHQFVPKSALTPFSKALSSHMNGTGLMGKATNLMVNAIVKHDMKHLY